MQKSCWEILRISMTRDTTVIKRAYYELIKRYHPDTAKFPEKKRRYTVKTVEIIQAYNEALRFAVQLSPMPTDSQEPTRTDQQCVGDGRGQRREPGTIFSYVIFFVILSLPVIVFAIMGPGLRYYSSMQDDSSLKMILSLPLGVIFAIMAGGLISGFTTLPAFALWLFLFDKYRMKAHSIIIPIFIGCLLNILIMYATDLHWPFSHKSGLYYQLLSQFSRFLGWSFAPAYVTFYWFREEEKYNRAKTSPYIDQLKKYEDYL